MVFCFPHPAPWSSDGRDEIMSRVLIFANGELPDLEKARKLLKPDDAIICADGGTRHALALGLSPRFVVGDMDSATQDEIQRLNQDGIPIELHPRDKNETDLELTLNRALEQKPSSIRIVGALGGRLDQTLGNISLLSDSRLASLDCRLDDGVEEVFFCRGQPQAPSQAFRGRIEGARSDLVSLVPWNGTVTGIRTTGLRWPLNNETLYPDKTRGISNEMLETVAEVSIETGLLLIVHRRL
jgi:thiamine pyrophosphokinase